MAVRPPLKSLPVTLADWDRFFRQLTANPSDGSVVTESIGNNQVTDQKLRDSAGVSVIGRAANTSGDPADIVAAANDTFLARRGDVLVFVPLTAVDVPIDAVRMLLPIAQQPTPVHDLAEFQFLLPSVRQPLAPMPAPPEIRFLRF